MGRTPVLPIWFVVFAACHQENTQAAAGDLQPGIPTASFFVTQEPVVVSVEVVDTPETRARGMMFREQLDENDGMLFIFPQSSVLSFWMRNTLIPLDMIFIGENLQVVGVVANAEPQTDTPRGVGQASQYVVEVNGGFAAQHGIRSGVQVQFNNLPDRLPL